MLFDHRYAIGRIPTLIQQPGDRPLATVDDHLFALLRLLHNWNLFPTHKPGCKIVHTNAEYWALQAIFADDFESNPNVRALLRKHKLAPIRVGEAIMPDMLEHMAFFKVDAKLIAATEEFWHTVKTNIAAFIVTAALRRGVAKMHRKALIIHRACHNWLYQDPCADGTSCIRMKVIMKKHGGTCIK